MVALLVGGIIILSAGVIAIVFGIPVKEFSFGNTLILAGCVVACTGALLIGLYFIGREFRNLVRKLDGETLGPTVAPVVRSVADVSSPLNERASERKEETLFTRDEPMIHDERGPAEELTDIQDGQESDVPVVPAQSVPWKDEKPSRARPDAAEPRRRSILFSSKRRDQTPDAESKPEADDISPSEVAAEREGQSLEHAWPHDEAVDEAPRRTSRPVPPPRNEGETTRRRFQAPRRAEAAAVTVVKSGVVDSMSYSLYSDGSIEAQMPEGVIRFASIDELRSHLDQRQS